VRRPLASAASLVAVALAALAVFPACAETRDVECDGVVTVINGHVDGIAMPHTDDPGKDMAAYAERLREYEAVLASTAVTDAGLAERFAEYTGMVRALREAAEDFARRGKGIDAAAAREIERQFDALEKRESETIVEINEYCGRS
jgi:hypothetical protein